VAGEHPETSRSSRRDDAVLRRHPGRSRRQSHRLAGPRTPAPRQYCITVRGKGQGARITRERGSLTPCPLPLAPSCTPYTYRDMLRRSLSPPAFALILTALVLGAGV